MNIIVLDDQRPALDNATKAIATLGSTSPVPFLLDPDLSAQILADDLISRLKALGDLKGSYLIFVDMGFGIAAGNPAMANTLRTEYAVPEDFAAEFLDGFACIVALLRNTRVNNTTVVINTGRGAQGDLTEYFQQLATDSGRNREINIQPAVGGYALARSEAQAQKILKDGIKQYQDFVERSGSGLKDPFRLFQDEVLQMSHKGCETHDKAVQAFAYLLGEAPEEVEKTLFSAIGAGVLYNALKTMGARLTDDPNTVPDESRPLSAVGAWLLALAAYRHVDGLQPWPTIFDIRQLAPQLLLTSWLLPYQNWSRVLDSIKRYYELCCHLFKGPPGEDGKPPQPGPLRNVSLSLDGGLRFLLDFPCEQDVGGRTSLCKNVAQCQSMTLAGLTPPAHDTSRALWDFWVSSSVADNAKAFGTGGLLGRKVWRMNVFPITLKRMTEVVFQK